MSSTNAHGFTIIELMIVVVLSGLLVVFAIPRMANSLRRTDVDGARTKTVALFNRARAVAIETNRHTALELNGTSALVTIQVPGGGRDTLAFEDFSSYGVALATSQGSIAIDPRGIASGLGTSTAVIVLSKGSHADTVEVTGFGRIIAQ